MIPDDLVEHALPGTARLVACGRSGHIRP
jgi:hypothetical protein